MVRAEPSRKPAMALAHRGDSARILDRGIDLEAVAHDSGVGQQPGALAPPIRGDAVDVEAVESL